MADGTIVVCDALRAVAESLAAYLERDGLVVVATVSEAEELLDAVAVHQPALVLLDVTVSRRYPGRLVAALARTGDAKVLMLGPVTASDDAVDALRDGVQGWVPDRASGAEMADAVCAVLRGEFRMPPELVVGALRSTAGADPAGAAAAQRSGGRGSTAADARIAALGDRERAVLECLVEGLDRRGIAVRLQISENTVKTHIGRILGKLGAHSRLEAAAIGRRAGLGDP
ncbi:response regulator transcription factor [Catenulispora pinisilvae]|uniref:response regulator transcription factor n=1 Tax=Catenulispora pinisilvae TaxID=2705253 RepID=UPI0018913927|nr:response regulator transcription factor [Catenulispora pinisilvae]